MIFATPNRGTGGAGAQGILQGLMAGQQSRQSDQKMEWLKQNQDRQTQQYEGDENNKLLYNMREVKNSGGNIAPLIDSYNKWRKGTTNFSDGDDFRVGNWDDHRTEGGGVNQATANKWEGDTGFEFGEKTTEQAPLMLGDKFFNFETFSAGAPKFKSYAQDRDIQKALALSKATGDAKGPSEQSQLAKLQTIIDNGGTLGGEDKNMYRQLNEKLKMTKPNAQRTLTSPGYQSKMESVSTKGWNPMNITDAEEREMVLTEQQSGFSDKNADTVGNQIGSMGNLVTLRDEVIALKGDVASGKVDNMLVDSAKWADDETFKNMDAKAQRKLLQTTELRSKLGMTTANFLKQISGAAVSDEEFQRIMTVLTGGDITEVGIDTIASALGGSAAAIYDDTKGKITNGMDKYKTPGTMVRLGKQLEKAYNPTAYTTESTEGGTDLAETGAAAITKQAKQAGEAVDKTVIDPIKETVTKYYNQFTEALGMGSNKDNPLSMDNMNKNKLDAVLQTPFGENHVQVFSKLGEKGVQALIDSKKLSPQQMKWLEKNASRL